MKTPTASTDAYVYKKCYLMKFYTSVIRTVTFVATC